MKRSTLTREISRLAKAIQARLDELYRNKDPVMPGSALDQEGLRDGANIVIDYLNHGEPGVAFEHLMYMIAEPPVDLSVADWAAVRSISVTLRSCEELVERLGPEDSRGEP